MKASPSDHALTELRARLERESAEASTGERRAALLWDAARAAQITGSFEDASRLYGKVLATQSGAHLAAMAWTELLTPGVIPWELAYGLAHAAALPDEVDRTAWELLCATRTGAGHTHPDRLRELARVLQSRDAFAGRLLWCAAAETVGAAEVVERLRPLADRRAQRDATEWAAEAFLDWQLAKSTWDAPDVEEPSPALQPAALRTGWLLARLNCVQDGHCAQQPETSLQHARVAVLHEDLAEAPEFQSAEQFRARCLAAVHYARAGDTQASARNLVAAEMHCGASTPFGESLTLLRELLGMPADITHNDSASARRLRALCNYRTGDVSALQATLKGVLDAGEWTDPLTQFEIGLWRNQLRGRDLLGSVQRAMASTEDAQTREAYVALATALVAAGQGGAEDAHTLLAMAPIRRTSGTGGICAEAARTAAVAFSDPSFLALASRGNVPLLDALSGPENRAQGFAELEHDAAWTWPVIAAAWALAPRSDLPRQEALADRCLRAARSDEERSWAFQLGLKRLPEQSLWTWFERAPSALVASELKAKARFVRALACGTEELAAERAIAWSHAEPEHHHEARAVALLAAAHCDATSRPERATQHALAAAALGAADRTQTHAALERALASGGSLRGLTVPVDDAAMAGRVALSKLFQGLRAEAKNDLVRLAEHAPTDAGVPLAANLLRALIHGASMLTQAGSEGHDSETTALALRRSGAAELVAVFRRARAKTAADTVAATAGLFAQRPSSATWLDWARAALAHRDDEALLGALQATSLLEGVSASEVEVVAALAQGYLGDPTAVVPVPEGDGESYALMHLDTHPPGSAPDERANALLAAAQTAPNEEQLDVLALVGWNQYAAGDSLAAREAFRAVTADRRNDVAAWEGLRRSAISLDDFQGERDSTRSLAKLVASKARRGVLCFRAYECAHSAGDLSEASDYLTEAVRLCSDQDAWAETWLAQARTVDERHQRANEIASQPGRPRAKSDAHWMLARAYRESQELERAAEEAQRLLLLTPNHAGGLALHAELLLKLGHLHEALTPLRRIFSLDSLPKAHRVMAAVGLAETLGHKLGKPDEALVVLDQALLEFPNDLRLIESAARYASELGLSERAELGFRQVAEQGDEPRRRMRAAKLTIELGRTRGASEPPLEMLAVLSELEPENEQHLLELTLAVERLRVQSGAQSSLQGAAGLARADASFETNRRLLLEHPVQERAVHQHAQLAKALGKNADYDAALKVLRALSPHRVAEGTRFDSRLAKAVVSLFESQFMPTQPSQLAKPKELGINPRDKLRADGGPWATLLEQVGPLFGVRAVGAFMLSSRTRLPAIGWDNGFVWALPLADSANDAEAWVSYMLFLLALYRGLPPMEAMKLAVLATDEASLGARLARTGTDIAEGDLAIVSAADVYRYVLSNEFRVMREEARATRDSSIAEESL